jgi:tetratricopeptide (TPR) repeat protein
VTWKTLWIRLAAAAVLAMAAGIGATSGGDTGRMITRPGLEAFDYAFRFASAILSDARDRALAQEAVVMDMASSGEIDEAVARVDRIDGWRRGTALADLAAILADQARGIEARSLLARAEEVRAATPGWQEKRIAAHIAASRAAGGDVAGALELAREVEAADGRQYSARLAASLAAAKAERGDVDGAMAMLGGIAGDTDVDAAWWRAKGFARVAAQQTLTGDQKSRALEAARRAAEGVPGFRRSDALVEVSDALRESGDRIGARETLILAERITDPLADTMPVKAPTMARIARSWALMGEGDRSRSLLKQATNVALSTITIDQPAILAAIGSAHGLAGDDEAAANAYSRALDVAESLVNARPRALALAEICRSLGRDRAALTDERRSRLNRLLGGLRDPW